MDEDKWIATDARSDRLVIRFRVKGHSKQFFISTGLEDSDRNRAIVRMRRDAILNDIALESFDPTLERYQFGKKPLKPLPPVRKYSLGDLWELFTEFKSSQLEETTILSKYASTGRYIDRLPTQSLDDAPKIRNWMLANLSHYMSWQLLGSFSSCCNWAVDSGLITINPFAKLKIGRPKKSSQADDYKAFTLEQRDIIIDAFENHAKYSHYAPLVKFLFWTGCRPGEAFALTWGDISRDCCRITISKSRNIFKILKGTKNGKKRIFPCKPGSKLQSLLLAHRPSTAKPKDLLFVSKTGKTMNSSIVMGFWREVRSNQGATIYKYPGVVAELAGQGKIPYLKPYATRHTFATWAISSGVTPDKVAFWIGDNVETVLTYYCHPEVVGAECPDF